MLFRLMIWSMMLAAAACAPTAGTPPQPGQVIVLTDKESGRRIETTYGELAALASFAELRSRNYGRAIAIATTALQSAALTPKERSSNHVVRGMAHRSLNNLAAARLDLDSAISHDPANALAFAERGVVNSMQRLVPDAMADFARSIEIRPSSLAHFERGMLRLSRRDLAGARGDFDQAIALAPNIGAAYFARGLSHHLAGKVELARADYQQAMTLNPDDERPRAALAALERRRSPAPPRSRQGEIVQF